VSVPNKRSKPKRTLIVLIYMFLGIIISTGYILAKEPLKEIIQKIKEN
jgi:LPS O-antigen subunit length determinant protein (WzzB/FepE family)